jgi:hypothetical protein
LDVNFDGRRIWSFRLRRDSVERRGLQLAEWPKGLRPFLQGVVDVSLVEHSTNKVLFEGTRHFGDPGAGGRVDVRNPDGKPLSLDNSGRLVATFEGRDHMLLAPLLDAIQVVLDALRNVGVEPFLAYGTALGAVRDGKVIGHDSDADLGYVSAHSEPVDVVRESFRLQRGLAGLGYRITRYSGAAFKVHVREGDGVDRGLDVFAGFFREGRLHLMGEISAPYRREWVYPCRTATLDGRPFPVPADADRFLALTYGPHWRTPDPAFQFHTSHETVRQFSGWFRGMRAGRAHWDRYYANPHRPPHPAAVDTVAWSPTPSGGSFIDVGCGRGKDVEAMAARGLPSLGLDFQPRSFAETKARLADVANVEFQLFNLREMRHVLPISAAAARMPGPRTVLVKHLVDCIDSSTRQQLWRTLRMILADGDGTFYLQFLTSVGDDGFAKSLGLRGPVRPARVKAELSDMGATILDRSVMPVSDRDGASRVCRMVGRWEG